MFSFVSSPCTGCLKNKPFPSPCPSELLPSQQAYSLRDAMNSLAADKPAAAGVAKVFYRDIEQLTVFARQKNGPACTKAYNDAQEHLTKYLSLI